MFEALLVRTYLAWAAAVTAWQFFGRGVVPMLVVGLPGPIDTAEPQVMALVEIDPAMLTALLQRIGREWATGQLVYKP